MSTPKETDSPSCAPAIQAADVFRPDTTEPGGHCFVTLLCTLRDEAARKRYLELTREIALPRKAASPSCLRAIQTIPRGSDKFQVLWVEEWTAASEFKSFMQRLFEEHPRLHEVNDCLVHNPEVTISSAVRSSDL